MASCPAEETLEALLSGCAEEQAELDRHLTGCVPCRERVRALREDRALFDELQSVARPAVGAALAIPGYRIEGELRRGGQGVVYRAVQEATKRAVALKVLAEGRAPSYRERRRFEREIDLAARLRHPGIVTIHDSGIVGEHPWYAMELVEGVALDEHVARARPSLRERLGLFLELADAIVHAHRSGVIHRDLKPANVLVDLERRVRVLDFGVALCVEEALAERLRVTSAGEFLGTLAYAAPEQLSGKPGDVDARADVYALGAILYELVTGELPCDVSGAFPDAIRNVIEVEPRDPAVLEPAVDRDLALLLMTALAKEPEERYSSVEALRADVARWLADEPLAARGRSTTYVLAKALRRHRRAVFAAALLFAGGALLIGAFARERGRAERARENAELVRAVIQDILGAAAPQRMGGDVRLLEVIELAGERIESTLAEAPDAQAAVQLTIGDTYRRLLMSEQAEPHLRKALERLRAVDGPLQLEVARALDLLGLVLAEQNRPEAIAVQEEALALRRRALDENDSLIAESERGLALALVQQFRDADIPRAETLLRSALERFRTVLGPDHPETAETEVALSRVLSDDGDSAEVEALLEHALLAFERAAPEDPRALPCLNAYSSYLQWHGRFDEARALLDRAVLLAAELYGDELAPEMLRRHANLEHARGEPASAEELTRQALALELAQWGKRRPEEQAAIAELVQRLQDGRPGAPEPPYAESFRLLRRFRGDGAFELAQWMNGIALAMREQGRARAAEPMLREALEIRCRAWGADCPVRQHTLLLLAQALHEDKREREARELLEESLSIAGRNGEAESGMAREARGLLASCCAVEASAD